MNSLGVQQAISRSCVFLSYLNLIAIQILNSSIQTLCKSEHKFYERYQPSKKRRVALGGGWMSLWPTCDSTP